LWLALPRWPLCFLGSAGMNLSDISSLSSSVSIHTW
jgi:hypothetical protein